MFIDEKGRLFGKVSVIDILAIALIAVGIAGAGVAYKKIKAGGVLTENKAIIKQDNQDMLEVTMRISEVRSFTVDAIKVGDEVFAADTGKYFGEIKEVAIEEATRTGADIYGQIFEGVLPERYDVVLKVAVPGKLTDSGYLTANNLHIVYDAAMEIKTPAVQTFPQIEKITAVGEK